jgi:hypothetical protein
MSRMGPDRVLGNGPLGRAMIARQRASLARFARIPATGEWPSGKWTEGPGGVDLVSQMANPGVLLTIGSNEEPATR